MAPNVCSCCRAGAGSLPHRRLATEADDAAKINGTPMCRRYAWRHRRRVVLIPTPFAANSGAWVSDDPHVSSRLKPRPGGAFSMGRSGGLRQVMTFAPWPTDEDRREPGTTERRFCCVLLSVGNRTDSQGPALLVSSSADPTHFKVEDGYRTSRGPNARVRERDSNTSTSPNTRAQLPE